MKQSLPILKAIADKTRLEILLLLQEESLCVCELEYILGLEQSRISHSLKILTKNKLTTSSREGKYIIHTINHNGKKYNMVNSILANCELSPHTKQRLQQCKKNNICQIKYRTV